jgi:hypothetical protein
LPEWAEEKRKFQRSFWQPAFQPPGRAIKQGRETRGFFKVLPQDFFQRFAEFKVQASCFGLIKISFLVRLFFTHNLHT